MFTKLTKPFKENKNKYVNILPFFATWTVENGNGFAVIIGSPRKNKLIRLL